MADSDAASFLRTLRTAELCGMSASFEAGSLRRLIVALQMEAECHRSVAAELRAVLMVTDRRLEAARRRAVLAEFLAVLLCGVAVAVLFAGG